MIWYCSVQYYYYLIDFQFQVNFRKELTNENAENDPNSEYNKSGQDPAFQYTNFETEVLKDELKTREQFPNNTLDQKPNGIETSKERYEKVINAPKSSDVQKFKPK